MNGEKLFEAGMDPKLLTDDRSAPRPIAWFSLLSATLAASVLLPLPGANGEIAHIPSFCPFYAVTGLPCPFCGLTRAFVCLGHGDFRQSLHWHPLGWLLYVLTIAAWVWTARALFAGMGRGMPIALDEDVARRAALAVVILTFVAGIVRTGLVAGHVLHWP